MSRSEDHTGPLDAALAAASLGPGPVTVEGSGPLADRLRGRLGSAVTPAGERPATVVDTTGDLARIEQLMHKVDALGTVVLAGPAVDPEGTVDLYADLHVRGLTVITVAPSGDERA